MFGVTVLLYEKEDLGSALEAEVPAYLERAGVRSEFASRTLRDLDMDPEKVAQFVTENPSEAWVICAASRPVVEWFSRQSFPTMCLYGGFPRHSVAGIGPDHVKPFKECLNQLIELGHKRIVMYTREDRRKKKVGNAEAILLESLKANGIPNTHSLPDWEESLNGFRASLYSLFEQRPPTAIIIQEPPFMMVAIQFLKDQGIATPDKISLFCTDYAESFEWCEPQVAHSRWDKEKVLKRVLEWVKNVSSGKEDRNQTILDAEFIKGETIGPPPSGDWNQRTEGKVW